MPPYEAKTLGNLICGKTFKICNIIFLQGPTEMNENLRYYEGQLVKFTNVVKGWQARWFILNPETGTLDYYLVMRVIFFVSEFLQD